MPKTARIVQFTHIFLSLLDASNYLCFGCKRFVFVGIDLVLSEDGEGCFDVEFLVSDFPGGHGGRSV